MADHEELCKNITLGMERAMSEQSSATESDVESSQSERYTLCHGHDEQGSDEYNTAHYRSSTDQPTGSSSRSSSSTQIRSGSFSKPHKAQDAGWEAVRVVKSRDGGVGLSHFRFLQRLGSGDIGTVYLSQLRGSGCYFAIKVMDKKALADRNKLLRAQTEQEILEALDHPFLPTLYAHVETQQFSCLVMEFCPGGDLHVLRQRQPSKRFSDDAVRFYAAEVLLALEYLHMMGIVYRDLKPENVLVREDGHIMLSDFDLSLRCIVNPTLTRSSTISTPRHPSSSSCSEISSCILPLRCVSPCSIHPSATCLPFCMPRVLPLPPSKRRSSKHYSHSQLGSPLPELLAEPTNVRSMSFVGTHEYLAPEIILGDGHGSAVDWWTLGIFMFELLYGKTPFKGADNEVTLMNVVTQPLQFPEDVETSMAVKDLIRGLLHKDPHKRLACVRGAAEVKQHAFFEGVNWALIRCAIPPEIPSPLRPLMKDEAPVAVPQQQHEEDHGANNNEHHPKAHFQLF